RLGHRLDHFAGRAHEGRGLDPWRPARHQVWSKATGLALRRRARHLLRLDHAAAGRVLGFRGQLAADALDRPRAAPARGFDPAVVPHGDHTSQQPVRQRTADGKRPRRLALALHLAGDRVAGDVHRLGGRRRGRCAAVGSVHTSRSDGCAAGAPGGGTARPEGLAGGRPVHVPESRLLHGGDVGSVPAGRTECRVRRHDVPVPELLPHRPLFALSFVRWPYALSTPFYVVAGTLAVTGSLGLLLGLTDFVQPLVFMVGLGTAAAFVASIALPPLIARDESEASTYSAVMYTAGYLLAFV